MYADLRHAVRSFIRMPGFAAICVLTLALGIGATTSIFSALYHVLLRPMPFEGGDRMGYVWMSDSATGMGISPSRAHIELWQKEARLFEGIEAYNPGEYTLMGGTEPEPVHGAKITRGLPDLVGVQPVLGRTFTEDEMRIGAPEVTVLSESLWRRRFGGERNVLGKRVEMLDGKSYQIVGVMPDVFAAFDGFSRNGQIWFPARPDTAVGNRNLNPIVQLKEGTTLEAAQAELGLLTAGLKLDDHGSTTAKYAPTIMTPDRMMSDITRTGLPILFYAVSGVLLIACANIAGLLLVRLHSRARELAIRSAIGARKWMIIRMLGVEAFVLAVAGGTVGVILAAWLTGIIRTVRPEDLNSLEAVHLNGTALAFAAGISMLTAVLFLTAPIVAALRSSLTDGLISGAGSSSRVTTSSRTRSVMVAGQIALSLVLLIGSLVLVRSVQKLQAVDLGFDPANVLTMSLSLPDEAGFTNDTRQAYLESLKPQLEKLPGVQSVSLSSGLPTSGGVMFGAISVRDRTLDAGQAPDYVWYTAATPEYAQTAGLKVREGRFFQEDETGNPIVINESWARKLWPGGPAVGRQMKIGNAEEWMTIVGVVADTKGRGPTSEGDEPQLYTPYVWAYPGTMVAIRTAGDQDPTALAPSARRLVSGLNGKVYADDIATLQTLARATIALNRFYMMLLSAFAALALVLSVVGLYGVISNTVAQRTREIGVRMALGATPQEVQRHVLGEGMKIALLGVLLGSVGAWFAVKKLEETLFGFNPHDPISFIGGVLVLGAGALFATWLPSRRATRIDPLEALRAE